ncbi:zinc-dependent peptidase [Vandammella animalimorsus]|uniref:Zinc-dependent peptidase n=1 Tax=Vandammella animalimorsus TaxID=2029117 RepID=A0A2A2AZJ0_9BURK|nr:M90 family metallopeptidase [Vandammella animalimorsus]PAT43990.1 hypothetical protein CK621_01890 [Vandammella animalimorsus]
MGVFNWLLGKGASARAVAKKQAAIDEGLWRQQLAALPFLHGLEEQEQQRLRQHCAWFLASKTFDGVQGLQVTDAMALGIALQACLPILNLGTQWYEGWTGIVVYPGAFVTRHAQVDAAGVVHAMDEPSYGEAWEGGPLVLAWEQARPGQQEQPGQPGPRMNVVIHEFAHKLDMAHGVADGMPHLGGTGIDPAHWQAQLMGGWRRLGRALDMLDAAMPPDVDPDSPQGQALYDGLPLDPYAATDPAEFFAVSSESFFTEPQRLQQWQPEWYALLRAFYRQDPLARLGGRR